MIRERKCHSKSNSFVTAAEQICLQPVLEHRQRRGRRNFTWQAIPHLCSSNRKDTTSDSWPTTGRNVKLFSGGESEPAYHHRCQTLNWVIGSPGQWVIFHVRVTRSPGHHSDPVWDRSFSGFRKKMPKMQNVHLKCQNDKSHCQASVVITGCQSMQWRGDICPTFSNIGYYSLWQSAA